MKPENLKKIFCVMLSASLLLPGTVGAKNSDESEGKNDSIFTSENLKKASPYLISSGIGIPAAGALIWGIIHLARKRGESGSNNDSVSNAGNNTTTQVRISNDSGSGGNSSGSDQSQETSNPDSSPQQPKQSEAASSSTGEGQIDVQDILSRNKIPGLTFYQYSKAQGMMFNQTIVTFYCYIISDSRELDAYLQSMGASEGVKKTIEKHANQVFRITKINDQSVFTINDLNSGMNPTMHNHFFNAAKNAVVLPEPSKEGEFSDAFKRLVNSRATEITSDQVVQMFSYNYIRGNSLANKVNPDQLKQMSCVVPDLAPAQNFFAELIEKKPTSVAPLDQTRDSQYGYAFGLRFNRAERTGKISSLFGPVTYHTYCVENISELVEHINGLKLNIENKKQLLIRLIAYQNRFLSHDSAEVTRKELGKVESKVDDFGEFLSNRFAQYNTNGWATTALFYGVFIRSLNDSLFSADDRDNRVKNTTLSGDSALLTYGRPCFQSGDYRLEGVPKQIKPIITSNIGDKSPDKSSLTDRITPDLIQEAYRIDIEAVFVDNTEE